MDKRVFQEWLSEPRAINRRTDERKRILYVDNCSGHIETEGLSKLQAIRTGLRKFPVNATDMVQPADSFVIAKIKDAWRRQWDLKKAEMMGNGAWMGSGYGQSGKLKNPGKVFFLHVTANAVREVNQQRDRNGLKFARKAMIRTGMSLNVNGLWEESQLFDKLQVIFAKHRSHFDGEEVE